MPLDVIDNHLEELGRYETEAFPLIKKAIARIDSGVLPPYYASDLQKCRRVLADMLGLPEDDVAALPALREAFASELEGSSWFRKRELNRIGQSQDGPHLVLDEDAETEMRKNFEFLLRYGLPGLFRGIERNRYHNYSHCLNMSKRALVYTEEFDLQFSAAERQALTIGLVGHDSAHSGVIGPADFEHNVQYAVKLTYLFMDYYGFSKPQTAFAIEKGILPTVSFDSEFVPQDAIGVAAELGDLAFEVKLSHFLLNSLHVLEEQIPGIIAPPDNIANWLRSSVRDGFLDVYLRERLAEMSKISGLKQSSLRRMDTWLDGIRDEITELADYEETNKTLPAKFEFFSPIKERALSAMIVQQKKVSSPQPILSEAGVMRRTRRSIFAAMDGGLIPVGSSRHPRKFLP